MTAAPDTTATPSTQGNRHALTTLLVGEGISYTGTAVHTVARETTVRIQHREGVVRIEVRAAGSCLPELLVPGLGDEHGRGLLIVEGIADRWGVQGGDVVWCEIGYRQMAPAPLAQQTLRFAHEELPAHGMTGMQSARAFVRREATRRRWAGDVEDAAHAVAVLVRSGVGVGRVRLGVAVGEDGALVVEVHDCQRDITRADLLAVSKFQLLTGAEVRWSDTKTGRVARATVPVQRVERAGGAA